jgi:hypothetical protein
MADPNAYASAASLADELDGTLSGTPLPYAEVDLLRVMQIFDLDTTAVFPEGENVSSSRLDQITTLAKILAVRWTDPAPGGKTYTLADAIFTLLAAYLAEKPVA